MQRRDDSNSVQRAQADAVTMRCADAYRELFETGCVLTHTSNALRAARSDATGGYPARQLPFIAVNPPPRLEQDHNPA